MPASTGAPMADPRTLKETHARRAIQSIRELATVQGRKMALGEQRAVAALIEMFKPPAKDPKPSPVKRSFKRTERGKALTAESERRSVELQFPIGLPVLFQSTGRDGKSPARAGVIFGYHESTRGLWIIVAESGAAPGVVVHTRSAMVEKRQT